MSSGFDYLAPRFFLEINGRDAQDLMPYILEFEYKDNEAKADELSLTISNKGIRWLDDFRLKKGTVIKTRWGYANSVSTVREMHLVKIESEFPEADIPSIKLLAYDRSKTISKRTDKSQNRPKVWGNVSSSDIAKAIAKQHKLKMDIENSNDARKEFRIQPATMDDMGLLHSLAYLLHWDFYIEAGILHFHSKRHNQSAKYEYVYYTDRSSTLIDFSSSIDLKSLGSKTGKAAADPQTGKSNESGGQSKEPVSSEYAEINANVGSISYESEEKGAASFPSAETNPTVVAKQAKAQQEAIELSATKAEMTVVGNPKLVSKGMVVVNGVGRTYSGSWRVIEATHKISSSVYTTSCELKRPGRGGKAEKKADGASSTTSEAKTEGPNTVTIEAPIGSIESLE
jgi:phage protein D